ncbi:MAG: glycosyltransferase [Desulfobacterium sp.]|nr:glycosyltransferase [Desulfobacterium sp.]
MTKVTHIFKTYFPETHGGLEEAIRQIGRHSVNNGFDVEVVAAGKRNLEVKDLDGITAKFHKSNLNFYSNPVSFSFARKFKAICQSTDILHFHFTWPTAEILTLLHRIKIPMVVTFYCDIHKNRILKTLYLPIIKQFLKKADRICVISKNFMETVPYLHEFRDKAEEVSLWFDESRFTDLSEPDPEVAKLTTTVKPYGLFAGVLRWYKGIDILLDASKNFKGNLVIVGQGPLYNHLRTRIKQEEITNVYPMGFQPDNNLKTLIQESKFIVLPSTSPAEAFGQALLEGLYFSKPLISTELGTGTSFVNLHNHTGFVVKPRCSPSLCRAMNTMIEDQEIYDRFTANTFEHYNANFTAKIQGDNYSRIYRSLLKKPSI